MNSYKKSVFVIHTKETSMSNAKHQEKLTQKELTDGIKEVPESISEHVTGGGFSGPMFNDHGPALGPGMTSTFSNGHWNIQMDGNGKAR